MHDVLERLEALDDRVRRLERRLAELEPETMPGVGRREHWSEPREPREPSEPVPVIDALADALGALGIIDE